MIGPSPKVQQELLRLLDAAFVRAFETVAWDDATACGRAFRNGARVVVPDITLDRAFKPYVKAARRLAAIA